MAEVIVNPSRETLLKWTAGCRSSLKIISPFAKTGVLREILEAGTLAKAKRQLICRAEDRAVLDGALDYEGLKLWVDRKARLRVADASLHAKVYLFDDKRALVTSANLTDPGLDANWEVGLSTTDAETVSKLVELFDANWNALTKDVTSDELTIWQKELAELNAAVHRLPAGLKDRGVKLPTSKGKPGARNTKKPNERRYYLKMYATGETKEKPDWRASDTPEYWGGLTFSNARTMRPTKLRAGDVVFVCWQVQGKRKRVAVRGEVERQWDRELDVAPEVARKKNGNIARWPNVVWLTNVEILDGPIAQLLDIDAFVDELGAEMFVASMRTNPAGGPAAARKVFNSSRSHPELTEKAGAAIDQRFQELSRERGAIIIPSGQRTWWDEKATRGYRKQYR